MSIDIKERIATSYLLMDLLNNSEYNENKDLCHLLKTSELISVISANIDCVNNEEHVRLVLITLNII